MSSRQTATERQNLGEALDSDYERALSLHDLLENHATGGRADNDEYQQLRSYFVRSIQFQHLVPDFVRDCRTLSQFWAFIKAEFPSYAERREFLRVEFSGLLEHLELDNNTPSDVTVSEGLHNFNANNVNRIWQLALDRRYVDPEGAITAARTLLETVCKHILDEQSIEYNDNKIELPQLYKLTAKELNLAPEQHEEEIFKQILGGCSSVVHGLGSLRNRLGDAHGKGKQKVRPAARHAELAVNLSGSVALFLIETLNQRVAD